jgi:thiosulfate/3-mercaptopyruvate sulfurtransferase
MTTATATNSKIDQYANPGVLVTSEYVRASLDRLGTDNPPFKLIEVDVDTTAYDAGHIPGALGVNWQTQLQDQTNRDIVSKDDIQSLLGSLGVTPDDAIVLYGDHNNWFAAYALWILKYYGHADVRLLNGGRVKWLADESNPITADRPPITPTEYRVTATHPELRAHLTEVLGIAERGGANLVDVRSPDEFTGKVIAPPGMTETAQRGGHIPGAASVPWLKAVDADGTFKPIDQLRAIYLGEARVDPEKPTIAYCRIGERSSHTWFVLKHLIGLEDVKNYDGSWTEYGSVIGVPIEK